MAPRLVNTAPGDSSEPSKPGDAIHLGLKSETFEVQLGTVQAAVGFTGLTHVSGKLPEENAALEKKQLEITLETSEHRRPIVADSVRALVGSGFVIQKASAGLEERSVYEFKSPLTTEANSLLAHFKIRRKSAWALQSPDWTNLTNVAPPFFGLEHSVFNTGAFVFLRDDGGTGSLVVGGPASAFNTARPGQTEVQFAWKSLADDEAFEVFIYIDTVGRPPPFPSVFEPMVEVWVKTATDAAPVVVHEALLSSLGTFPDPDSSIFPNARQENRDDEAIMYLGNLGTTGEQVVVDDWAFYTDYRRAVLEGEPMPTHEFVIRPDGPVVWRAADNELPTKKIPARWFSVANGITPVESFRYNPGVRSAPAFATLTKPVTIGRMALQRTEPRIEGRDLGVVVEAFLAAEPEQLYGDALGVGFGVEDGEKSYRVMLLFDGTNRHVGIAKTDASPDSLSLGYYVAPAGVDHRSLKFVRLVVDRLRQKVLLFVEDEDQPVLTKSLSDEFPAVFSPAGRIVFGHLDNASTGGKFHLAFLRYLMQYKAWEGIDTFLPDSTSVHADARFTASESGTGSFVMDGPSLIVTKSSHAAVGTHRYYSKSQDLSPQGGIQVDFRMRVDSYTDSGGRESGPSTPTGSALRIFFGNKMLQVGFYDCGIHGRKVAVLSGSGTESDILNQTALGRLFSADVDFLRSETYRVIHKAFEAIEVWAGTTRSKPIIRIPWRNDTDGFDLPLDTTAPAVAFGHFEQLTASSSRWEFVRWGFSNGYDTAVKQTYSNGPDRSLFGGRVLVRTKFEEL